MKHIVLMLGFFLSFSSFAAEFSIGTPSYGGSGCPDGTANVVLNADGQSFSILFDEYFVESGGIPRKSCNFAIPLHVPRGISVALLKMNYQGFNHLPAGASSRFHTEYFFAGSQGPSYTRTFYGPLNANYYLTDSVPLSSVVWSACGEDVILRSNSSIFMRTNNANDDAIISVDRAEFRGGLIYHLQWKRC